MQIASPEKLLRVGKKFDSKRIYFISPEDLILNKLLWYKKTNSDRHLEDVESIPKISKVDLNYLKKQARNYNILGTLEKTLKK